MQKTFSCILKSAQIGSEEMPEQKNDFSVKSTISHIHDNHQVNAEHYVENQEIHYHNVNGTQPKPVITYHTAWKLNQTYLPREPELESIREMLFNSNSNILQIRGIGGLGKTSICCQLFQFYLDELSRGNTVDDICHLGWISYNGDLKSSIYKQINAVELTADKPEEYLKQAGSFFNLLGQSLLLFIDNADDISREDIAFLRSVCCCVILTARYQIEDIDDYKLPLFSPEDCIWLYREHSNDREETHTSDILQILKLAGYHTQTICLLAKTQRKSGYNAAELLNELTKSGFSLKEISVQIASGRPEGSVEKTFTNHMKKLFNIAKIRNKKQLRVLQLFSLMAPNQPISQRTFSEWYVINKKEREKSSLCLKRLFSCYKKKELDLFNLDAMKELIQRGWLETNATDEVYIHPVIAATVHTVYPPNYQTALPLIHMLIAALKTSYGTGVVAQDKLLPHCISVAELLNGTLSNEFAVFLNYTALILRRNGDYTLALKYAQQDVNAAEQLYGTDHSHTAVSYNNIADVYRAKGDYDKAVEYLKKALEIFEKVYDTNQIYLAILYTNIGAQYRVMCHFDEALEYSEKALEIFEKTYGQDHPNIVTIYNNIATAYNSKGNYDDALFFFQKAIAIFEKAYGKEQPDAAVFYNNIASVYLDKCNYDNALDYYEKSLVIREKVLGKEHPDTATTYNNISSVYKVKGDYNKALEYLEKALAIRKKKLGKEHPDTGMTYHNIGLVYDDKKDYGKALEYLEKARSIFEKTLGKGHPYTRNTYKDIADLYQEQVTHQKQ